MVEYEQPAEDLQYVGVHGAGRQSVHREPAEIEHAAKGLAAEGLGEVEEIIERLTNVPDNVTMIALVLDEPEVSASERDLFDASMLAREPVPAESLLSSA